MPLTPVSSVTNIIQYPVPVPTSEILVQLRSAFKSSSAIQADLPLSVFVHVPTTMATKLKFILQNRAQVVLAHLSVKLHVVF